MNIKQELEKAIKELKNNDIDEPILKSKIILSNVLSKNKEYLLINEKEELDSNIIIEYQNKIKKICKGIPLQYIISKQEFMKLEFYVNENVLIPQPDTEILVEEVINICETKFCNDLCQKNILDLCTGSGAIGISICKYVNNCKMVLTDISNKALDVTKKNCVNILGKDKIDAKKVKIIKSDLFEEMNKNEKFDIIVSNPPYIKTNIIKTLGIDVQNEPVIALDGGKDGLRYLSKNNK